MRTALAMAFAVALAIVPSACVGDLLDAGETPAAEDAAGLRAVCAAAGDVADSLYAYRADPSQDTRRIVHEDLRRLTRAANRHGDDHLHYRASAARAGWAEFTNYDRSNGRRQDMREQLWKEALHPLMDVNDNCLDAENR